MSKKVPLVDQARRRVFIHEAIGRHADDPTLHTIVTTHVSRQDYDAKGTGVQECLADIVVHQCKEKAVLLGELSRLRGLLAAAQVQKEQR
jgi:hypothetical protein